MMSTERWFSSHEVTGKSPPDFCNIDGYDHHLHQSMIGGEGDLFFYLLFLKKEVITLLNCMLFGVL